MKLLFIILTLASIHVKAANYYLSSDGNDQNDGKSKSTSWSSLARLSEALPLLQSGDSILFKKGSTFHGQLIITGSGLYLGTYGIGLRPIFSGAVDVSGWTPFTKNIWRAECAQCLTEPGDLFIDTKKQTLGRFPNNEYLTVTGSPQSRTSISDTSLNFETDYWNKAEVVVKSSRWTIDKLPVAYYKDNIFYTTLPASYPIQNGFGYFIQKHLSTLDQSGEWFFNENTKEFFLYLDSGILPSNHLIEASLYNRGLSLINSHDIVIKSLTFTNFRTTSIHVENCSYIEIRNTELLHSAKNGLEVISSTNLKVVNNLVSDSNNNGIVWNNSEGSLLRNVIKRTGLYPGRGDSGNGTYIALSMTNDNLSIGKNIVQYNTIDSTGYSGIDFRTGNTLIKRNTISNFCLVKDDGAGIYTWSNTREGNTIDANIIFNGIGNGEGTLQPYLLFVSGIYIDDRSSHIGINGNNISYCSTAGILIHNAKVISIIGNTVFANGTNLFNKERGQLYIKLDTLGRLGGNVALGLEILKNKWMATNEASYCVYLGADKRNDLSRLGVFSENQFSASKINQAVARSFNQEGLCQAPEEFSLATWQSKTNSEIGSAFKQLIDKSEFDIIGKDMIANGHMTRGTSGWIIWPAQSTIIHDEIKVIDGPALEVFVPTGTEALLYNGGFSLSNQKYYRLSFSIVSTEASKIEFVPLMYDSPWKAVGEYTCFASDTKRKDFTYFFRPTENCTKARVNFKGNKTFWIDSISLYEVSITRSVLPEPSLSDLQTLSIKEN